MTKFEADPYFSTPELFNKVREKMLQLKLHNEARLIDALYLYGAQVGQVMTEKMLNSFCKQNIKLGHNAIRDALKAEIAGRVIFEQIRPSISSQVLFFTPNFHGDVFIEESIEYLSFYLKNEGKKSQGRGRPVIWYVVPDPKQLFRRLDIRVPDYLADTLFRKDVFTLKAYRMAIQRGDHERRPGTKTRWSMANHLRVSKRTTALYDKELGTIVTPQHDVIIVDTNNIDSQRWDLKGAYLKDVTGKNHAAIYEVASKLIARDSCVRYIIRKANHYQMPGHELDE